MTSHRTVSRISRILALIPYVLEHSTVDVDEVMDRFGYTRDQLTKDLNTIFVCGLPGYGPGDLMEAYMDEDEVVIDAADYYRAFYESARAADRWHGHSADEISRC